MFLRVADRYQFAYVPEPVVESRAHPRQLNRTHVGRIARDRIAICERWMAESPTLRDPSARLDAQVALCKTTGKAYYAAGDLARARRWLLRALRLRPRQSEVWLLVLHTAPGLRRIRASYAAKRHGRV
jgi:hypothetical protein